MDKSSYHQATEVSDLDLKLIHDINMILALGREETGYNDVGPGDDIAWMLKHMACQEATIPGRAGARMSPVIHEVTIGTG
ncbi:MAG: hypothetical protein ACJ72W_10310 [Actinoallomurus sp.]